MLCVGIEPQSERIQTDIHVAPLHCDSLPTMLHIVHFHWTLFTVHWYCEFRTWNIDHAHSNKSKDTFISRRLVDSQFIVLQHMATRPVGKHDYHSEHSHCPKDNSDSNRDTQHLSHIAMSYNKLDRHTHVLPVDFSGASSAAIAISLGISHSPVIDILNSFQMILGEDVHIGIHYFLKNLVVFVNIGSDQ